MFRRLKEFRRIVTRYDKLDLMFSLFIYLALSLIAVCSLITRSVNSPKDYRIKGHLRLKQRASWSMW
jgi:hypothetical protein